MIALLLCFSVRAVLASLSQCTNQIDTLKMNMQNIVMPAFSGVNPAFGTSKMTNGLTQDQ